MKITSHRNMEGRSVYRLVRDDEPQIFHVFERFDNGALIVSEKRKSLGGRPVTVAHFFVPPDTREAFIYNGIIDAALEKQAIEKDLKEAIHAHAKASHRRL